MPHPTLSLVPTVLGVSSLLLFILYAQPASADGLEGTLTARDVQVGNCHLATVEVAYQLDQIVGEPTVLGDLVWTAGAGTADDCLSHRTKVFLAVGIDAGEYYIDLRSPIGDAGDRPLNIKTSPDWSNLFCSAHSLEGTADCLSADAAGDAVQRGAVRVLRFEILDDPTYQPTPAPAPPETDGASADDVGVSSDVDDPTAPEVARETGSTANADDGESSSEARPRAAATSDAQRIQREAQARLVEAQRRAHDAEQRRKAEAEVARIQQETDAKLAAVDRAKESLSSAGTALASAKLQGSRRPWNFFLAICGGIQSFYLGRFEDKDDSGVDNLFAFGVFLTDGFQARFVDDEVGIRGQISSAIGVAPFVSMTQLTVAFDYVGLTVRGGVRHIGAELDEEQAEDKSLHETYDINDFSFLGSIGYRFFHRVGSDGAILLNATSDGHYGLELEMGMSMFYLAANFWVTDDGLDTYQLGSAAGFRWATAFGW